LSVGLQYCHRIAQNVDGLAMWWYLKIVSQSGAKFIDKSSMFIPLLGIIRQLELKLTSEKKIENIFDAPPYCQTAGCV
jgi:hypothetical protein